MNIRTANENDKNALIVLINSAYHITSFFKFESRIDKDEMDKSFSAGTFLILEDSTGPIGCIYYKLNEKSILLNLLSVRPDKKGKGLSKILIKEAEEIGKANNCSTVYINVVNLRKPLFELYEKFGYVTTGTAPFPKPTKIPCHLITMAKQLT